METSVLNMHTPATATEHTVTTTMADQVLSRHPGLSLADGQQRLSSFEATSEPDGLDGMGDDATGNVTTFVDHVHASLENDLVETPSLDPDTQRQIDARANGLAVCKVQVGTFYRPGTAGPPSPRAFSIEWEMDIQQPSMAWVRLESYLKQIRIEMVDPAKESAHYGIILKFNNIVRMFTPCDSGERCQFLCLHLTSNRLLKTTDICFDLGTPPVFQKEKVHDPLDGSYNKQFERVGELCARHGDIAPYAYHLRVVLCDDNDHYRGDVLDMFSALCPVAAIRPLIRYVTMDAQQEELFSRANLNRVDEWIKSLGDHWRVAFQVEALLDNGIAHTRDVLKLKPRIDRLISRHGSIATEVMRYFVQAAASRPTEQPLQKCFEATLQRQLRRPPFTVPNGLFFCHRVTLSPTRLLLEGPNTSQSNRIIREFQGYEDYFLRVSFRDEDRLQYRCTRDVDGETLFRNRVGKVLKEGLYLAGRRFEFLGYSCSALKTHAVWFVSPFQHSTKGWVTADYVRNNLGNFEGVIYSPSKYGARMAQAFTATEASVKLHKSQWSEMPDIKCDDIVFTDGVGTISQGLATMIWQTLRGSDSDNSTSAVQPTAYQIRFLGYKGMVAVDPHLEGIYMRLRPSMRKFDVEGNDHAEIEIASAFGEPNPAQLNRPLVSVLEDRGIPIPSFLKLQEEAVSSTRSAARSVPLFVDLLKNHNLCEDFWVPDILRRLNRLGFELNPGNPRKRLDTPFLSSLRSSVINYVLRGIKYRARIPIPESYMFPGVADEGPAYVKMGFEDVYCLPEGKIFACIQNSRDEEPTWIRGPCIIYRSPVIHPGDVQRVEAIGKPPRNCLFGTLRNVVVFPAQGSRSLPNSLAGGDLDGDTYEVVQYWPLLGLQPQEPAAYPPAEPYKLDRRSTIHDVCKFIVEFINSDNVAFDNGRQVMFRRHAIPHFVNVTTYLSDQLEGGTLNTACLKLAELHSRAVDYLKNGRKVTINELPWTAALSQPDWREPEQPNQFSSYRDHRKSPRALGWLYRNIMLAEDRHPHMQSGWNDALSSALWSLVRRRLHGRRPSTDRSWLDSIYATYREELKYISTTYSLSKTPLSEEELVMGMILATCSSEGHKRERVFAMNESLSFLLRATRERLAGESREINGQLARSWDAWIYSQRVPDDDSESQFGWHSFGLIALGLVLKNLVRVGILRR
ncbi:RNA dependent RNA polymerase-domain-containing protein [Pisolithus albus]|nr:RNA dependent RNA polymerase-domain-containing protein [Pisolithus albus]